MRERDRPRRLLIGMDLTRTSRVVAAAFDRALSGGAGSFSTWPVLPVPARREGWTQREIAETIGIESATLDETLPLLAPLPRQLHRRRDRSATGGSLMTVELNHTIVHARDPEGSARFIADILGVAVQPRWGPFHPVVVDHGLTLDYMADAGTFTAQHYAFLVSDDVFDAALRRLTDDGADTWADPHRQQPGRINHDDGGRGVYFDDPDGHLMELITVPYGGWPDTE